MKFLLAVLLYQSSAQALPSFWIVGEPADNLVHSLIDLGMDRYMRHDYTQAGITSCMKLIDDRGDYFPDGRIGDYVGVRCQVYGEFDDYDEDGVYRSEALIPTDDRQMLKNPELKEKLQKLQALHAALDAIVIPKTESILVDGKDVVVSHVTGILGLACEGYNGQGQRQCVVNSSSICPKR